MEETHYNICKGKCCAEFDVEFSPILCYTEGARKERDPMPNIKPISELRNYSTLLESVSPGDPIYLTRNGHGAYALVDIADQEEFIQTKAALQFMCEMNKGMRAGEEQGWLTADEVRARLKERRHAV